MSKTTYYNLQKDEQTDYYDVDKVNSNSDIIDAALKGLEDNKAVKGVAYVKNENNLKVVQGVPVGGQNFLGAGPLTGAIKIKLPQNKSSTMFKFKVNIDGFSEAGLQSNDEYIIKGYNYVGGFGSGVTAPPNCQVTILRDYSSGLNKTVYFCTGSTEDYILIGEITDRHSYKAIYITDIETHNVSLDWSKDWNISLVTTLEDLDSTKKVTVTPSLNATHLNGVSETTTGEASKLLKFSTVANTLLHFLRIRKTSTTALNVQNDSSVDVFNVDTQNEIITGSAVSTTGGANKLFKFSDVANTWKAIFKIMKTSTTAFRVANDSDVEVFNVDTTNGVMTGLAISESRTPSKVVKRDLNSNIDGVVNLIPVKAVTRSSTIPNSLAAIDDYIPAPGDLILLASEQGHVNDGIYVVAASGTTWARSTIYDTESEIVGKEIFIQNGTTYKNTIWKCMNTGSISVGTTKLRINQKIDIGDTMQYLTGIDTNNVKDSGFYYVESCTNCPGDGFLEVYKGYGAYILQRLTLKTGQLYEKIFSTGYWGSWKSITTETELAVKANLASPAFTGTPTAPTAAIGTDTTQLASCGYVNDMVGGTTAPAISKYANGYVKMANGLIIQWGYSTVPASGTLAITFPIAFPTEILTAVCSHSALCGGNATIYNLSASGAILFNEESTTPRMIRWIAIGC